ncbi:hypothetical protein [Argonema antarcticum]|uniref:hypothetical protein n=1 Tax=Argonema antarcticum TaxID=2942763 RepID=UPI0020133896|nr:hypothetical protein [Argonema antarcticum]MCL1471527.1 hypothetical protein [Argonema antarcticum A004/B2]
MTENFYLLLPEELPTSYNLSESIKNKLSNSLSLLSQHSLSSCQVQQAINSLFEILGTEEILSNGELPEQVYDEYFNIRRVQPQKGVAKCLVLAASTLSARKLFDDITGHYLSTPPLQSEAMECWVKSHWVFISLIQGLIICCLRFESELQAGNLKEAAIELETASALMLGSAVAMEMAGSFSTAAYLAEVRYTMPNQFSGIMMQDHSFLISIWRRLHPVFASLPEQLKPQHEQFTFSYKMIATAHKSVCEKFNGKEEGSLLSPQCKATDMLSRFESGRLRMLNASREVRMAEDWLSFDKKQSMELSFVSYRNLLMRVFGLSELASSFTPATEVVKLNSLELMTR